MGFHRFFLRGEMGKVGFLGGFAAVLRGGAGRICYFFFFFSGDLHSWCIFLNSFGGGDGFFLFFFFSSWIEMHLFKSLHIEPVFTRLDTCLLE